MSRFEEQSPEIFAFLNGMCAECHPPSARAMARNLLGEHRWSSERLQAFLASDGAFLSPAEIEDKLKKYQEREVRTPIGSALRPAYARPDNLNNSISMPAGTELGTVIDLTRLGHIYAEAYVSSASRSSRVSRIMIDRPAASTNFSRCDWKTPPQDRISCALCSWPVENIWVQRLGARSSRHGPPIGRISDRSSTRDCRSVGSKP